MKRIVFLVAFIALTALLLSCPASLFKTPLPDELLGSWTHEMGSTYRYSGTFTFRQYDFSFSETSAWQGVFNEGYTDDVEEVFLDEKMFRTPGNMYIWWHVAGNLCYLGKTNPGGTKPVLAANWWVGSTAYSKE